MRGLSDTGTDRRCVYRLLSMRYARRKTIMEKLFNEIISDTSIIFENVKANSKGVQERKEFALTDHVDPSQVLRILHREAKTAESASAGSVSLLVDILQSTSALDGYKGTCQHHERVPSEFNQALRSMEERFLDKLFLDSDIPAHKNMTEAQRMKAVQTELTGMRKGSYSQARTHVANMFCKLGKLPVAPNGKLFTVAAITKMVDNALYASRGEKDNSLSAKLAAHAKALRERGESFEIGDNPTAIAALKEMLATYEGLEREASERLTALNAGHMIDIANQASVAVSKASEVPSMESLDAMYENGQLSLIDYQIKAKSFHNVDIVVEEATF